jgi:DNA-binding NarL/FixJ family response regulator
MNTTIVIAVPDLMISTRIADVAQALDFTPVDATVATLATAGADAALVVVDIGQAGEWEAAVRALKAAYPNVPVLAFGPHVNVEASRAAVAVGSDRFVTRGKFMAELPQLLEQTARR